MTNAKPGTLNRLLNLGEAGRIGRADTRTVTSLDLSAGTWTGTCQGMWGTKHKPRITVDPRPKFGCSCQDHQKQRGAKGPCKHVIALAKAAIASSE